MRSINYRQEYYDTLEFNRNNIIGLSYDRLTEEYKLSFKEEKVYKQRQDEDTIWYCPSIKLIVTIYYFQYNFVIISYHRSDKGQISNDLIDLEDQDINYIIKQKLLTVKA